MSTISNGHWEDYVRQHGMEFAVNKDLVGRAELGFRNHKPLEPDELDYMRAMELEGSSPFVIAKEIIAVRDRAKHPGRDPRACDPGARKVKTPTPGSHSPGADTRLVTLKLSPRECGVIARAIGVLLKEGYAPVHARRLLEKLVAGEAQGRLIDKE